MPLSMGKVLGRGIEHQWDGVGHVDIRTIGISSHPKSGDTAWNYESVLNIYRRIEDWQGRHQTPHAAGNRRVWFLVQVPRLTRIQSLPPWWKQRVPLGCRPSIANNGRLMEDGGGASIIDVNVRDGKALIRLSKFMSSPYMDRPNLTVLTARIGLPGLP